MKIIPLAGYGNDIAVMCIDSIQMQYGTYILSSITGDVPKEYY
jgi:hypothetical protein